MRSYRQRTSWLSGASKDNADKAEEVEKATLLSDVREPEGPLAILTTRVWRREATVMRFLERKLSEAVARWTQPTETLSKVMRKQFVRDI